MVRRRYGGAAIEEHAQDVIAAEYRHTTARGVSGAQAPDPQLHSHVVIIGAIRADDRIVAVASRPIFRAARELGAFYRSALAEELTRAGYTIDRNTGKEGRYFEIAGVPRVLLEDFSGPTREVARAAERFRARHGRRPSGESCATSRSRIAGRSSRRPAQIYSGRGLRRATVTRSGRTRPPGWSGRPNMSRQSERSRIASKPG